MLEHLRKIEERLAEVDRELSDPAVLADQERSRALLRERARLAPIVGAFREWEKLDRERREAEELARGAGDEEMRRLAVEEAEALAGRTEAAWRRVLEHLVGDDPDADRGVIVEIRAGVGGEEAALFAADLYRMYHRWAERHGHRVELIQRHEAEAGGLREVVFSVSGRGVFDRLRFESGGHRVQRVPKTESQGRIHTSLATVAVLPEAEEVDVEIRDEDLEVDTFRAGGPGGQNVNKTSSAVRITHRPTGLVVVCQDESSQHKNRAKALRVLRARLYERERERRRRERDDLRRSQVGSGDRSERVRTYNFPQDRVTDHRIRRNFPLRVVLEGELDDLFDALRRHDVERKIQEIA